MSDERGLMFSKESQSRTRKKGVRGRGAHRRKDVIREKGNLVSSRFRTTHGRRLGCLASTRGEVPREEGKRKTLWRKKGP